MAWPFWPSETYRTGIVHAATVGAQSSLTYSTRVEWLCIQVQFDSSIAVPDKSGPPPLLAYSDAGRRRAQGQIFYADPSHDAIRSIAGLPVVAVCPVACDRSVLSVGGCFARSIIALPDFATEAALYYDR